MTIRGATILFLVVAVLAALSTSTYGEMYKTLGRAGCVSDPGEKCIFPVGLGPGGRRGRNIQRCECRMGFSCKYIANSGYICDRFSSESNIRKIFF